jgi:hypothetical protein
MNDDMLFIQFRHNNLLLSLLSFEKRENKCKFFGC